MKKRNIIFGVVLTAGAAVIAVAIYFGMVAFSLVKKVEATEAKIEVRTEQVKQVAKAATTRAVETYHATTQATTQKWDDTKVAVKEKWLATTQRSDDLKGDAKQTLAAARAYLNAKRAATTQQTAE